MRRVSARDRSLGPRHLCAMVALLVMVAMLLSGSALAATPSPGWMVRLVTEPTEFSHAHNAACEAEPTSTPPRSVPCDSYRLVVTNAGSRPTSGTITIADTLSSNVTAVFVEGEELQPGPATEALTCTTSPIRCTYGQSVPPGGTLIVTVNVTVAPTSEATATSTATIEGGGAATASATESTKLNSSVPEKFGVSDLVATAVGVDGAPDTLAGDHPYGFTTSFDFNNVTAFHPGETTYRHESVQDPREIVVDLPPGFVGDPQAAAQCPLSALTIDNNETDCPKASEVGTVTIGEGDGGRFHSSNVHFSSTTAIYNLVPEAGYPAEFGFTYLGQPIHVYASVVPMKGFPGGYALQVRTPGLLNVSIDSISVTFFGDPAERDGEAAPLSAFFTNPVNCSAVPLKTRVEARPWEEQEGQPASEEEVAEATSYPQLTGCELLQFQPTIALTPETTEVDTPSGYVVEVAVPQSQNLSPVLATPELKDATVSLPPGVSVSPSAADGLASCSNAEIDLESTSPGSCPPQSKVGTVKIATPLLAEPLEGQVYVGEPECSPCEEADAQDGKMLRLFLQVQGSGVRVKLEGRVSTSSSSGGQLTTTFDNNPQFPFSTLRLTLNGGPWAPLANPQSCGSFQAASDLSPWSAPITPDATPSASVQIGGCGVGQSFAPGFEAGSERPNAGGSAPFNLSFSRSDGEQDLSAIQVHMPPGLLGILSKVQLCPEPQAASGTCGPESRIGHSEVASGAGQAPFWVRGEVSLTGPYDGAPFGLSVLTHAHAGPFNLGDVVVRAAVNVDPTTSAITVTSGPLPQILDGVPLRIQKVEVAIDREGFMLNPTNCRVQQLTGKIASAQNAVSGVSTPFTVLGCANLPFKPKLTASAQGQGSKADGTRLSVKVSSPGLGQANVAKVDLRFPKAISSRLETLQHACLQSVFESNAAACDPRSVIGTAIVHTPILPKPLIGPAYLVSHGGAAFPDVEFILQGEGITLILDGQTYIDNKTGITSSRFESVPDAPFTSFETILPTGPHSIFTANVAEKKNHDLCGENLQMPTTITAQNGDVIEQSTAIAIEGCGPSKGTSARKPTRAQELAGALKACRRKYGHARAKRATCEKQARRRYAAKTAARGMPSARPRGGKG
jgi:hypothetical protein